MTNNQKLVIRYSDYLKQMVVADIEQNGLTIHQCQFKCDIIGGVTIQNWIKKFEKKIIYLIKLFVWEPKMIPLKFNFLNKELKTLKEAYTEAMLEFKVHKEIITKYPMKYKLFNILKQEFLLNSVFKDFSETENFVAQVIKIYNEKRPYWLSN